MKKRFIFLFLIFSRLNSLSLSEQLTQAFEKEKYNEVLKILKENKSLVNEFWEKIEKVALEKDERGLRQLYLEFYPKNLENNLLADNQRQSLSLIISRELRFLRNLNYHRDEDVLAIRRCFELIFYYELRENFYDVLPFIVYPLLEVRRDAYRTLALFKDDRMFPAIMKLLNSENALERTYALDALYYIRDERTMPILIQALKDKNKSVRYYAIRTLESLEKNDAIPYFIRILQEDVDPEVRIKSIHALVHLNARSAFSAIARAVSDENSEVRREATRALVYFAEPSGSYYISEQLARETENELQLEQIEALMRLKNSGGMAGLNRVMMRETNLKVRLWALYVAGYLADMRGYDAVLSNVYHQSPEIRAEAAFALGYFRNKSAVKPLLALVKYDLEYAVQAAALFAILKINHEESFPELFEIMEEHQDVRIRYQAKQVLQKLLQDRFRK
ncbi:MAG: HEAT repeat domain-containing protein [Leptospiraceae bacterium]|nr:HEAT repeat domain-containing protein [Leptospiraceae bacterium]MDW8306657.1 HEAT repeat domain-containing protein [Leptospiraceae bacterium]